jgi:mono/diheme cytochrome c family protein
MRRWWSASRLFAPAAVLGVMAALVVTPTAQGPARSVKDGVYSAAQADAGKTAYTAECATCHGAMTSSTPDMAPLLNDWVFQEKWNSKSVGDLFERIRTTMPQNKEGTLSPQRTAEIVAYILNANQMPPGATALPSELDALSQIRLDATP